MRKVTSKDVAKKAGVSQSTVSRVINGSANIKSQTRKKVLKAMEELNYVPNLIARNLIQNRTRTIGLIVDDISRPIYAESSKLIIDKARKRDYDVLLVDTEEEEFDAAINTLLQKRIEGILVASISRNNKHIEKLQDRNFPIVLFNRKLDSNKVNSVVVDNQYGSFLAIEHLYNLGHRTIGFLNGPLKYSTFNDRYVGYKESLQKFGLEFNEQHVYHGEFSEEDIYNFIRSTLEMSESPTCFFVASDTLALYVLDAVSKCGYKVPEEISIVGFDNINISSNPYVGLTTVSQRKEEMASIALNKLIELIENDEKKENINIELEPFLLVRKTTNSV